MEIQQLVFSAPWDAPPTFEPMAALEPQLVFLFGPDAALRDGCLADTLCQFFPESVVVGCSAAGVVGGGSVHDGTAVLTAVRFNQVRLRAEAVSLVDMEGSFQAGQELAQKLRADDLSGLLVLGPGVDINGTSLLEGMQSILGAEFPISGGLAGDDAKFVETWTLLGRDLNSRHVVAVGFYGPHVQLSSCSMSGWEPFGPIRKITDSHANVVRTLDGEPALEVYRRYLGEWAKELPASALLFPFALYRNDLSDTCIVRTILGIDEANGSLILAGNAPKDGFVRLMHASTDALVEGAQRAAERVGQGRGLALIFSCIGRKLVLGGRVDEEVEAVSQTLGPACTLTGFYSYGEIGPLMDRQDCVLHNQTLTLTLLAEA